ncbi:hypothetical protein AHF37_11150 [Paragonimus kellicotti]|nr:hypothetical protein AHF37_11150 [Paragonimus kellicotti]
MLGSVSLATVAASNELVSAISEQLLYLPVDTVPLVLAHKPVAQLSFDSLSSWMLEQRWKVLRTTPFTHSQHMHMMDQFDSQTVQSAYELATHTATEQQLTDLHKRSETSQREIEEHVNRFEQCREELQASRAECQQTTEALEAMQNRFLMLQKESELSRTEEANQRLSLQSSLQETEIRLKTKEDEVNELKDKIAHLTLELERLSDRELATCPSLQVEEFERKLVQRDEIIKLQRKRLKELKKTLDGHLRGGQISSDHDSVEGLVTGLCSDSNSAHRSSSLGRLSNRSTLSLPTVSLNNALTERCLPILPSIVDNRPLTASDRPCQTTTLIPNSATHMESPATTQLDQTHHHNSNNNAFTFNEMINLRYLRHVILKFLLSRENEALHLVRVLSTLLIFDCGGGEITTTDSQST